MLGEKFKRLWANDWDKTHEDLFKEVAEAYEEWKTSGIGTAVSYERIFDIAEKIHRKHFNLEEK